VEGCYVSIKTTITADKKKMASLFRPYAVCILINSMEQLQLFI
jgi:hypothetical protein